MPSLRDRYDTATNREFLASALYVALVLLAALLTIPHSQVQNRTHAPLLLLGTALGLTLAHWFAFRLASGITDEAGAISTQAAREAVAQVAGGMTVAVIASVPYLFLSGSTAWSVSMLVLVALLGLAGFSIARLRQQTLFWSAIVVLVVLALAFTIVSIKIAVSH